MYSMYEFNKALLFGGLIGPMILAWFSGAISSCFVESGVDVVWLLYQMEIKPTSSLEVELEAELCNTLTSSKILLLLGWGEAGWVGWLVA